VNSENWTLNEIVTEFFCTHLSFLLSWSLICRFRTLRLFCA